MKSTGVERMGFTLLELLAVVAVVGILAALIFPNLGAARQAANRARTKVQFNQWATAIEAFRGEYGYYPSFHDSGLINGGAGTSPSGEHPFHDVLAGQRRDRSALPANSSALVQNKKRLAFHTFGDADFTAATATLPFLLRDAFDNISIAVLVDRNLDGVIDGADYVVGFPAVMTADGGNIRPGADEIPSTGLRVGVAFYCADPTATASSPQFIRSWK